MYTNFNLSIRHWRIRDIKQKIAEAQALIPDANVLIDKPGYVRLMRSSNKELFKLLDSLGMFEFHTTNCGAGAYRHQIVLYLHIGWKMYKDPTMSGGKWAAAGVMEVHHLDGVPGNDIAENLEYTSPLKNKLLSVDVPGAAYYGRVKAHDPFFVVRRSEDYIALLGRTLRATLARLARESFCVFQPG